MKGLSFALFTLFLVTGCTQIEDNSNDGESEVIIAKIEIAYPLHLTLKQANNLAELPLACMQTEYPNKLGQVLASKENLGEPSELHPAFYGCFDWHSAVHGHWSLVKLLKDFPELEQAQFANRNFWIISLKKT